MRQDHYIRKAKLIRVIDGDTVELDIDLGFMLRKQERVRVLGVNCPEMKGPSKSSGEKAKLFTIGWFESHSSELVVKTHQDKEDSFGRFLAEIESGDDSLGVDLLSHGMAVPYN